MPATDFSAAILVTGTRLEDLDPSVLTALQEEDCLLIHSCTPEVTQAKEQRFNPRGDNLLTTYSPGQLSWSIEASVLRFDGLADYHPGAALSRRLLPCANASYRRPFQFGAANILTYENPRLGMPAGTLPTIAFTIAEVCATTPLDTVTYPPFVPSGIFATVPTDATPYEIAPLTEILSAAFIGTDPFGPASLLGTWYDGDPAGTGVAITSPLAMTSAQWSVLAEPTLDYVTTATTSAALQWPAQATARTATHLRISRGTLVIRDIALAAPLSIPAGYILHLPAGAITLQLTWPLDGHISGLPVVPSRWLLGYVLGGARTDYLPAGTTITMEAFDADPISPGTGASLTAWTITPSASAFAIIGGTASPIGLSSTDLAPPGGWDVAFITATLEPAHVIILKEEYAATIAAGSPLTLDTAPILDLAAAPD